MDLGVRITYLLLLFTLNSTNLCTSELELQRLVD